MCSSQHDPNNYLTWRQTFDSLISVNGKNYTTTEAAAKIGVSRQTLHAWIEGGLVVAPKPLAVGKNVIRLWTKAQIDEARNFKGTLKPGPRSKVKKK